MAISQDGFANAGRAGRGGPQRGKSKAKLNAAKFTQSRRGPLTARKMSGGTPKPGKLSKS